MGSLIGIWSEPPLSSKMNADAWVTDTRICQGGSVCLIFTWRKWTLMLPHKSETCLIYRARFAWLCDSFSLKMLISKLSILNHYFTKRPFILLNKQLFYFYIRQQVLKLLSYIKMKGNVIHSKNINTVTYNT